MLEKLKKIIFVLTPVFVVSLVFPIFEVYSVIPLIVIFIFWLLYFFHKRDVNLSMKWLILSYFWWILSLILARIPLDTFLAPAFWRRDAKIFIAYLPFLVFSTIRFRKLQIKRFIFIFFILASIVSFIGVFQHVFNLLGLNINFYNSPNSESFFSGFHRAHNASGAFYGFILIINFSLLLFWKDLPKTLLYILYIFYPFNIVSFFLTLSRSSYIGVGFSCLMIFICIIFKKIAFINKRLL